MIEGKTIVMTGVTGQVAFPVAAKLARANQVLALGRFGGEGDRARVTKLGVTALPCDLTRGEFEGVPRAPDYVLHFAVAKSAGVDYDADLRMNAEGTGALMAHCHRARAFLHCSSTGVYKGGGDAPISETGAQGDHHRHLLPTYSLCKIAAEAVVRSSARTLGLPATIARLCVPYGAAGGWPWFHLMMMKSGAKIPLHPRAPNHFALLHEDDYTRHIEALLKMASVPATVVNWAGSEPTTIEDWCAHLGTLTGLTPNFEITERTLAPLRIDVSKLEAVTGQTQIHWRDGLQRMVEARNPELLRG